MLFLTNRRPKQSAKSKRNRRISFDYDTTSVSQLLYFCERQATNDYIEIKSPDFFERLKNLPHKTQLLFYIHGYNNNMEPNVFENTRVLQDEFDKIENDLVLVVPIIWPCDDDSMLAVADDYWDDQDAADASGFGFARALAKFDHWRRLPAQQEIPCLRRINVLAHSMGNRVLVNAMQLWAEKHNGGNAPMLFRNTFMVAPDVPNEVLEPKEPGRYIVDASRNVVVYFAGDDLAMPASKVANIKNKTLTRRLGMTGPEDLDKLPKRVFEVDCDDFNNSLNPPTGHTYFMRSPKGVTSPLIPHMAHAIKWGRLPSGDRRQRLDSPF